MRLNFLWLPLPLTPLPMKAQFSVFYLSVCFHSNLFLFFTCKKQNSDIQSVRQNRGENVRCTVFSSISSLCWEELRPLAGSQLYTKFKVKKRNLTYSQGWNYLPSIWYQKIPMFFVYFPPPKFNRGHAQNLQQEQSRVFSTQHSQSPPAQEEGSWRPGPRGHSASSVLFHFSRARKILSCGFSSLWLSLQVAERKRSYAQIPAPQNKTAFQLSTTKTKYKATVPPPVLPSITPQDKGHSHTAFSYCQRRSTSGVSKGTRGRFSGARAGFYYSVKNKNKCHLLSTSSASHDTSFCTYI